MYHHASDLIRDSELQATFHDGYTKHVVNMSGPDVRQRKNTRQEQRWQKVKRLGHGSFGTVWLESLSSGQSQVSERAVKVVKKRSEDSNPIDYSRELEAVAKFSHPRVSQSP